MCLQPTGFVGSSSYSHHMNVGSGAPCGSIQVRISGIRELHGAVKAHPGAPVHALRIVVLATGALLNASWEFMPHG
jgi:hypothetical protein